MANDLKDKCLFTDVDICIVCNEAFVTPKGNGIRPCLCGSCCSKEREHFDHMRAQGGVYLADVKELKNG